MINSHLCAAKGAYHADLNNSQERDLEICTSFAMDEGKYYVLGLVGSKLARVSRRRNGI